MELKDYQTRVLIDLASYLEVLDSTTQLAEAFKSTTGPAKVCGWATQAGAGAIHCPHGPPKRTPCWRIPICAKVPIQQAVKLSLR